MPYIHVVQNSSQVFMISANNRSSALRHVWEGKKKKIRPRVAAFISSWQTNRKLPGNALKQQWNTASVQLICVPWGRAAGTKPNSYPVSHEGDHLKKKKELKNVSRPWQTDQPVNWQIQTVRGRADLRAAPTVEINLSLTSGSVKLGHLFMCVMLHNQLCQPKRLRHCCVCGMWVSQL